VTLHAQALVYSDDPSALGERIVGDLAGSYRTEWAAEAGSVNVPDATCELHSWPEGLRLDAFAESSAALDQVENVVTGAIDHAAGRASHIDWYLRPSS